MFFLPTNISETWQFADLVRSTPYKAAATFPWPGRVAAFIMAGYGPAGRPWCCLLWWPQPTCSDQTALRIWPCAYGRTSASFAKMFFLHVFCFKMISFSKSSWQFREGEAQENQVNIRKSAGVMNFHRKSYI